MKVMLLDSRERSRAGKVDQATQAGLEDQERPERPWANLPWRER
jgi:hypothetical protein